MRSHGYDERVPRHTDVAQQRATIAAAVWRLATERGLESVSLRSVAAEAGVSMGRVQHYFRTKDELLLHGLQHAHQRMEDRIKQRVGGTSGGERDVLVAILEEMLGEHPDTRAAIRVGSAYAVHARGDERIAAVLTDGDDEIVALAVKVIAEAHQNEPAVDPAEEATALWAMVCGLGAAVALHGACPNQARDTLHYHLRRVLPSSNAPANRPG